MKSVGRGAYGHTHYFLQKVVISVAVCTEWGVGCNVMPVVWLVTA